MNLFELNENYRRLKDRDDLDPTLLKDSLDAIEDDRTTKWDNLATWIDSNNADLDWLTKRIKELQEKKKFLTNQNHNLMAYLTDAIDDAGYKHVRTTNHILRPRNYKASTIVSDFDKVPDEYKHTSSAVKVDKDAIYHDLKDGKEVPGAHLKPNRKVIIR